MRHGEYQRCVFVFYSVAVAAAVYAKLTMTLQGVPGAGAD
jgi:hypothetical protein